MNISYISINSILLCQDRLFNELVTLRKGCHGCAEKYQIRRFTYLTYYCAFVIAFDRYKGNSVSPTKWDFGLLHLFSICRQEIYTPTNVWTITSICFKQPSHCTPNPVTICTLHRQVYVAKNSSSVGSIKGTFRLIALEIHAAWKRSKQASPLKALD